MMVFFFYGYGDHRDLHVLTHSFPTRRASDLLGVTGVRRRGVGDAARHTRLAQSRHGLGGTHRRDTRRGKGAQIVPVEEARRHVGIARIGEQFGRPRSEEHTSELQDLMRISYAVLCLKQKNKKQPPTSNTYTRTMT